MATYEELIVRDDVKLILADVRAKFPGKRFRPVDTAAGIVVLASPSRAQWEIFQQQASGDGPEASKATKSLFLATCVYPEKGQVAELVEEWPGLPLSKDVQSSMLILAGQAAGDYVK